MSAALIFPLAALAEIVGCFAVWAWWRSGAAYGGVYIAASLVWLWVVEGRRPDCWDATGAAVVLIGAAMILFGPQGA